MQAGRVIDAVAASPLMRCDAPGYRSWITQPWMIERSALPPFSSGKRAW